MAKVHSPRFLSMVDNAREVINECTAQDLQKMIDNGAKIIDVRELHEFENGHIVGALHIGKGVIERDIEKHEFCSNENLVLYCGGGFRSAIAARSLQEMGYSNVFSVWGGWRGIIAEGLKTSK